MLFNSIDFALFYPIVFTIYWLVAKQLKLRNLVILASSYFFYGWWDWRFLFLIALSSFIDYVVGIQMHKTDSKKGRKRLLLLSLFVNLGFLTYFKYSNFFIETFVDSFRFFGNRLDTGTLNVILPVGISFYTFQTLSYTIDIYRKKLDPTKDVLAFFSFVAFFPQLVAGPIERASHLLPQFSSTYKFNYKQVKSGVLLMSFGLFKKMVIADRAAIYVNEVYNNSGEYGGAAYIVGTVLFAFQIYCDFSGYSDIAIGAARTMGFDLSKNFNSPYFSKSLTEFWRRWHISLSSWFRDYLYIPLGGSRKGKVRTYSNLFIVFVVSGLWHGAAMTFVIWGAIHGLILMIEKAVSKSKKPLFTRLGLDRDSFTNRLFFGLLVFGIVCLAWVFFRANSLTDAITIIGSIMTDVKLSDFFDKSLYLIGFETNEFKVMFISIALLMIAEIVNSKKQLIKILDAQGFVLRWSFYMTVAITIIVFGVYGDGNTAEFIYFQF